MQISICKFTLIAQLDFRNGRTEQKIDSHMRIYKKRDMTATRRVNANASLSFAKAAPNSERSLLGAARIRSAYTLYNSKLAN